MFVKGYVVVDTGSCWDDGSEERCLVVHRSLTHPDFCDVGLDVGRVWVCRRGLPEPSREKLLQWAQ